MDSYFYSIAVYFLKRTKRGVFLNSSELSLIKMWKDKGIPLNVVISGLKKGFKVPGKKRSLRFFEKYVENEFKNYKKKLVGRKSSGHLLKKEEFKKLDEIMDNEIKKLILDFIEGKSEFKEIEEIDSFIDSIIIKKYYENEKKDILDEWKDVINSYSIPEEEKEEFLKKSFVYKKREELKIPDLYILFFSEEE